MAAAPGGHTNSTVLLPSLTRSNHAGAHGQLANVCSSREHHMFGAPWMFMLESKEPISDFRNVEGIEGF